MLLIYHLHQVKMINKILLLLNNNIVIIASGLLIVNICILNLNQFKIYEKWIILSQ